MKISTRQYAISLYQLLEKAEAKKISTVIGSFVKILAANNDFKKIDLIIEKFGRIWNKANGLAEAEVVSVRELDQVTGKAMTNYIKDRLGAREVKINNLTDKNILGGFILKLGDRIIDSSLKSRIEKLKEEMIK